MASPALNQVRLKVPVAREDLEGLALGTVVFLDGFVFTGREGVYKKVVDERAALPEISGCRLIVGKGGMTQADYKTILAPAGAIYLTTVGYGTGALLGRGIRGCTRSPTC